MPDGADGPSLPADVERRLMSALRGEAAVRPLTPEEARIAAKRLMSESRGFEEVDAAMREQGLVAMVGRARGYTPFSRTSASCKLVVIVPYSSTDRDSELVGGLGLSEGEPASGVVTRLEDNRVADVATFDLLEGEFVRRRFEREELLRTPPEELREDRHRGDETPDLDRSVTAGMAADAFKVLLFDEHSSLVHDPEDQREMVYDLPLVSSIAELQYVRLEGLSASPDVSCCSCCCCCWGSCSSCA